MSIATTVNQVPYYQPPLQLAAQPLCVAADLVVDTYLADVVESLKEQGLTDEVDEIEIDVDGTWKPLREDQKVKHVTLYVMVLVPYVKVFYVQLL